MSSKIIDDLYYSKYLKYKNKYLSLKKMFGAGGEEESILLRSDSITEEINLDSIRSNIIFIIQSLNNYWSSRNIVFTQVIKAKGDIYIDITHTADPLIFGTLSFHTTKSETEAGSTHFKWYEYDTDDNGVILLDISGYKIKTLFRTSRIKINKLKFSNIESDNLINHKFNNNFVSGNTDFDHNTFLFIENKIIEQLNILYEIGTIKHKNTYIEQSRDNLRQIVKQAQTTQAQTTEAQAIEAQAHRDIQSKLFRSDKIDIKSIQDNFHDIISVLNNVFTSRGISFTPDLRIEGFNIHIKFDTPPLIFGSFSFSEQRLHWRLDWFKYRAENLDNTSLDNYDYIRFTTIKLNKLTNIKWDDLIDQKFINDDPDYLVMNNPYRYDYLDADRLIFYDIENIIIKKLNILYKNGIIKNNDKDIEQLREDFRSI